MLCETYDTSIVFASISNCLMAVAMATSITMNTTVENGFDGRKRSKIGCRRWADYTAARST